MSETDNDIKLTQYAHGAGCGCKIAPQVLSEILQSNLFLPEENSKLLVGNATNDDAAVYDLGNGKALIATADFFMPIVDDPFDFGRVAAANAISDVYAMGGTPTLALALLGWPVNTLSTAAAARVIEGARSICKAAGIPLAGGHSIDTQEPMFGLSVNGLMEIEHLKRNNTAEENDFLFLTKPLGVGILATAQKRKVITEEDQTVLIEQLTQLNSIGEKLGKINGVTAMTDITGFGLMGHVLEMAEGSGLTAMINYDALPKLKSLPNYLQQNTIPDATFRNWNAYNKKIMFGEGVNVTEAFSVLPDPQTNGGLLISVKENHVKQVQDLLLQNGLKDFSNPIGRMLAKEEKAVRIEQ